MSNAYHGATASGRLSVLLSTLIPAWEARPDSEHEQAIIRLIVGSIASAYLVVLLATQHESFSANHIKVIGIIFFFLAAVAIVAWLVLDPGVNPRRRIVGCLVDNYGATAALYLFGNSAAPVFVVYLWVTFGNGFRFGRRYLFFSMLMNVLGFCLVLSMSRSWTMGVPINLCFLVGIVVLPLYVDSLLRRLESALYASEVANRAKSNFLATMSHEIRTPLNGLIGVLDLLDMTTLAEKQQHYVNLMRTSSEWLLNVISDGLDFTKIEAGELILEPVEMDVRSTIAKIAQVFDQIARAKGIALEVAVSPAVPNTVLCDQNRLPQILNNLLNNALKFTDQGQIKLSVTAEKRSGNEVRICFCVEDSGIGIPEGHLEEIFLPFKQVEFADHRAFGGTGLGLAIVARLIHLMGGEIRAASQPGAGATFTFHLDVVMVPDEERQTEAATQERIYWRNPPRILLAEDNPTNQEVAATYLNHLGCKVVAASDGSEAVEQARQHRFDLILMDCQMPRMDGYEATRRIRAHEGDIRRTPIVALTAHITNQDKEKCFAVGMDDYMGKPYRIRNLQDLLGKWLRPAMTLPRPPEPEATSSDASEPDQEPREAPFDLHDFRNAMFGAIGGVELALLNIENTESCKSYLKDALQASQKAVRLASNLK